MGDSRISMDCWRTATGNAGCSGVRAGKPLKIAGISVTPKWDWTPAYTADVRESWGNPPGPKSQTERDARFMARAEAYARWLAERQGIDIPKIAFVALEDGAVVFSVLIEDHPDRFCPWRVIRKAGAELARIPIPNFGRLERDDD